jgi:hypothetical protein
MRRFYDILIGIAFRPTEKREAKNLEMCIRRIKQRAMTRFVTLEQLRSKKS